MTEASVESESNRRDGSQRMKSSQAWQWNHNAETKPTTATEPYLSIEAISGKRTTKLERTQVALMNQNNGR